jgi:hypothetical protein
MMHGQSSIKFACRNFPAQLWNQKYLLIYSERQILQDSIYRICSRNLHTFFSILVAEKSGYVKYADFFFVEVLICVLF